MIDPTPASSSPLPPVQDHHIFVGWDPGENMAHVIACQSIRYNAVRAPQIRRLALAELQARMMYTRPIEKHAAPDGGPAMLYDPISQAPMSTEHAIARFFVPWYQQYKGWALFVDGDIMCRHDIGDLFALADPKYAVMVVKHPPILDTSPKKGGMVQLPYERKNWSSVMLFNCAHMANRQLGDIVLNSFPGRDLHRFCWLKDEEIGELPPTWNHLVNVSAPVPDPQGPALVHFTLGIPTIVPSGTVYDSEWYRHGQMAGYTYAVPTAHTNGSAA